MSQHPAAPIAPRRPHRTHLHGEDLDDPWHWLRDRSEPAVLAYLEAENAYADERTEHLRPLERQLFLEMLDRVVEDDVTVPVRYGPYWYYERTVEGLPYHLHCRRLEPGGPEEIVLDENELAGDGEYFELAALRVSPDHALVAFLTDDSGAEQYTLGVIDLATGEHLPDLVEGVKEFVVWAADARTLFYVVADHADRPFRVMRHALGDDPESDAVVFEEADERFSVGISKTRDGRYLFVDVHSKTTSEVHVLDAADPLGVFRVVEPRRAGHQYTVAHHDTRFFIRTNDGAIDFKLVEAPDDDPGSASWREVLPHRDGVMLLSVESFVDHLVLWERSEGLPMLRVIDLATGEQHHVDFEEAAYELVPELNPEWHTHVFRFGYTSPLTPPSVFAYDLASRERSLLKETPVRNYDRSRYVCHRAWASSHDGVAVPITLVHRSDVRKSPDDPLLLRAYGAYGRSYPTAFSVPRLSLLDRGFVVAMAHVRGGGELGRAWYEDGKLIRKKNSFHDVIACAEHLVREGWTRPEKLALMGGSAGGLLVGATVQLRPDLFRAAIAQVPFVDVVHTMIDDTLPLTSVEWEEWGNPRDVAADFRYLRSYSPYETVDGRPLPALLVLGALNDPRVGYWEPAKWVAKMRALRTDDQVILLRTLLGAGHEGQSGRYGRLNDAALEWAFLIDQLEVPW